MRKRLIYILFLSLFFTSACGFKVVNQSELINFSILEITTSGNQRINYIIKNKLAFLKNNKNNQKLNLKLETTKNKIIKEKNIKNEITKYQILITVQVKIESYNSKIREIFLIKDSGSFNVSQQHSQTLNNERNLIELLSNTMADKILNELVLKLNDL